MKSTRVFWTSLVAILALTCLQLLSACGEKSNNTGQAAPPVAPAPPPGSAISSCQVGQIWNATYGCLMPSSNCAAGSGWAPQTNSCQPGQIVTINDILGNAGTFSFVPYVGTLQLNPTSTFFAYLKNMGVCDPYWVGGNAGSWACSNYTSAAYIEIYPATNGTFAQIKITATAPPAWWNIGGASISTSQGAVVGPYNNSQGLVMTGQLWNGQTNGLKVLVNSGTFASTYFDVILRYQNTDFAVARVQK